ncbi:MAG: energy-coupling factor ABC transporter ATP-binding protein [Pseudorhodobacter sp.]
MGAVFQTDPDDGIRLEGASIKLADRVVLQDITAHLTEKRIAILGRNGSGKTTLLRLMAGLVIPDAGVVRVEGIDPATERKAMLSRIGILFQNPDHQIIFPTVGEELAFGLIQQGRSRKEAEAEVERILAAENRSHWQRAPVTSLSYGQRQYLCLLAILAMKPGTILLDEPFAGLDIPTRTRLHRRIAALPQRVVAITHDPAEIEGYDRAIWIEEGRLRADNGAMDVIARFESEMKQLGHADADTDLRS